MCILYGGFTAWLLHSIAEPLWPPRKVCVSARLNVSVVKLASSPGCASGCVCCASGCVCCDGFLSFFFTRLVGNSWNLEGGVAGVDLGKTILSTVRSHQTGYIGFISCVGQLKNACFARNEIQVFVQEWHSVIFLIMPAFILTSLLLFWVIRSLDGARHYFVTWNRSGTLEPSGFDELKDECGFWIIFTLLWITPPILSHLILHATFVKPQSFQTLRTRCMRSLSILPSSHPQRLFQMQANAAPKQASHWLVFTCKCSSCVWKLVCSSLLGALKTMTSSSFRRMNEALWKETELLVQNFIFTPEGRSAMILITLKQGRAENQPDGELLQCRGIMLM